MDFVGAEKFLEIYITSHYIGISLWNSLPPSLRLTSVNFAGSLPASFSLLKTFFYSRSLRTGSATEWSQLWAALYKLINTCTIPYNTNTILCILVCCVLFFPAIPWSALFLLVLVYSPFGLVSLCTKDIGLLDHAHPPTPMMHIAYYLLFPQNV